MNQIFKVSTWFYPLTQYSLEKRSLSLTHSLRLLFLLSVNRECMYTVPGYGQLLWVVFIDIDILTSSLSKVSHRQLFGVNQRHLNS